MSEEAVAVVTCAKESTVGRFSAHLCPSIRRLSTWRPLLFSTLWLSNARALCSPLGLRCIREFDAIPSRASISFQASEDRQTSENRQVQKRSHGQPLLVNALEHHVGLDGGEPLASRKGAADASVERLASECHPHPGVPHPAVGQPAHGAPLSRARRREKPGLSAVDVDKCVCKWCTLIASPRCDEFNVCLQLDRRGEEPPSSLLARIPLRHLLPSTITLCLLDYCNLVLRAASRWSCNTFELVSSSFLRWWRCKHLHAKVAGLTASIRKRWEASTTTGSSGTARALFCQICGRTIMKMHEARWSDDTSSLSFITA